MRKYSICLFGSSGVRQMEIDENFMSDNFAIEYVERSLKHYHPVFYSAAIWREGDDGSHTLLAEFSTQITVTTKRKES